MRIALVGAGRIGRLHAETLAAAIPRAELIAVADVDAEAARAVAASVRVERWTTDAEALVTDPAVDAVVIASSTASHAPLTIAAARAGKDVFCEKPIALDLETTDAALAVVRETGVRFQIGFQRRFDAGYRRARELIERGDLGRIEFVRDAMRDPAPATRAYLATSGGLYRDMTIHNFDCVRWLMGSEPTELFAMAAALTEANVAEFGDVDTSVVSVRFAGGGLAAIDNSRRSGFGYDVRTEIFGSDGALFVGYQRETPLLRFDRGGVHSDHVEFFVERFRDAYVAELRAFVASIVDGTPTEPAGADARAALAMAYAAEASRAEGRPVAPDRF